MGTGEIGPKDVLETGFKALFGPVQDLFLKLTGPACEEYGLMWQDSVKMRRTKRLVIGLGLTKKMLEDAGIEAGVVPDKFLLPIFDGLAVEDDNRLSEMWSALLANAASRENAGKVRPAFIAILKQMAPDEAALLLAIKSATDADNAQLPIKAGTKSELDRKIEAHNRRFFTLVRFNFNTAVGEERATEDRFNTSIELL